MTVERRTGDILKHRKLLICSWLEWVVLNNESTIQVIPVSFFWLKNYLYSLWTHSVKLLWRIKFCCGSVFEFTFINGKFYPGKIFPNCKGWYHKKYQNYCSIQGKNLIISFVFITLSNSSISVDSRGNLAFCYEYP